MTSAAHPGAGDAVYRVGIIGPSVRRVGGQSVVVSQLIEHFEAESEVDAERIDIDPLLPGPFRWMQRIKYLRTVANSVAYLLQLLLRIRRFDVVHVLSASYWSFILSTMPAILVCRLYRKPVVLNYHSGEADDHLKRSRAAGMGIRLSSVLVVPSDYLRDIFARHGFEAKVVSNYIDVESLKYRARSVLAPKLLCNRSFESHYCVDDVLRAFRIVQDHDSEAELVVAGEGPLHSQLQVLCEELELANVRFVGAVASTTMSRLYDEADVYINASSIDNMPMSLLEAAAAGVPIVSTNCGGIPYMMNGSEHLILVDVGDVSALADSVIALLNDSDRVTKLTGAARKLVMDRYTATAAMQGWRAVYRSVV